MSVPAAPELEVPELPSGDGVESTSQQIRNAPREVEQSAGEPSGGGILDTILDTAKSIFRGVVSRISGLISGAANGVVGVLSGVVQKTIDGVRSIVSGARTLVTSGLDTVIKTLTGAFRAVYDGVGNAIRGILTKASGLVSSLRTKLTQAIVNAITGKTDILGSIQRTIRNAINGVINGIQGLVAGAIARVESAFNAALNGVNALADRIAGLIDAGVDAAYNALNGVIDRVSELVNGAASQSEAQGGGVGGLVRRAISSLLSRLFSLVRGIANRIIQMVRSALTSLRDRIKRGVEAIRKGVHKVTEWVRTTATSVASRVKNAVLGAVRAGLGFGRQMVTWAENKVRAVFTAITRPIVEMLKDKLAEYLAPMIQEALKQHPTPATGPGTGAFANAQVPPTPVPASALSAVSASASTLTVAAHDVLRGILKPDGDHFGFSVSATWNETAGVGLGVGATPIQIDAVVDYTSHQVGFFFSPGAYAQISAGAKASAGEVDAGASWGSVMSFGANKGKGVEAAYGGWFTNVGGGVNAQEVIGGSTGANFYVGAAPWQVPGAFSGSVSAPPGTTTPGTTTPGTTVPGTTTPGTTTPGTTTPGTAATDVPAGSWDVFFATQKADLSPATNATLDAVVSALSTKHSSQPSAIFTVDVVGEASPRWRHPGRGTPGALNQQLSEQRAAAVKAALDQRLASAGLSGSVVVHSSAVGSTPALNAGTASDDNNQAFREARISAVEHDPAVAPTTTGGGTTPPTTTPPTTTPPTTTPPTSTPGGPMPGAGPTMGWDSNVSASIGGDIGATAYGQFGASYSILFAGPYKFSPAAETPVRVLLGILKMTMDIGSLSVGGFLRDLLGTIGAFIPDAIVEKIANFFIPVPGR